MGKLVAHATRLTIDGEFLSLEDCFEAFRRSIEYAEANTRDEIIVICNSIDTIEYQRDNGNSVLATYDDLHKVMIMRIFLNEGDQVIKPIYIFNHREYQIACDFMRQVTSANLELKEEWLV